MTDGWPFVGLLVLAVLGLWAVGSARARDRDRASAERQHRDAQRTARAQAPYTPQTPLLTHWQGGHYAFTGGADRAPLPALPMASEPAAQLPGVTTLADLRMRGWTPAQGAPQGIGVGGVLRLAPLTGQDICHVVFAAPTDGGKTNLTLLYLLLWLHTGYQVFLCDIKFRPYHERSGIDWGRVAAATTPGRALTGVPEILTLIEQLAEHELPQRLTRWNAGQAVGAPVYLFVEEVPYLAGQDRRLMGWLGKLLRLGRELGIFVAVAVQDLLVATLGGTIADQAQLRTRYYGGGDAITGRRLMLTKELPEPPDEPGVMWLRSKATGGRPELVRVPLVTAADVDALLPVSPVSRPVSPVSPSRFRIVPNEAEDAPLEAVPETSSLDPMKRAAALAALRTDEPYGAIIERIWQVKSGGGTAYKVACAEMRAIIGNLAG